MNPTLKLSPNSAPRTEGKTVKAIVLHKGEGSYESIINTFADAANQVSAHFVVAQDGRVCNMVGLDHAAWHTGVVEDEHVSWFEAGVNPNDLSVGIELEGFADGGTTPEQLAQTAKIVALISKEFNLFPDENVVSFHREVDGQKSCPGYNVDRVAINNMALDLLSQDRAGVIKLEWQNENQPVAAS